MISRYAKYLKLTEDIRSYCFRIRKLSYIRNGYMDKRDILYISIFLISKKKASECVRFLYDFFFNVFIGIRAFMQNNL